MSAIVVPTADQSIQATPFITGPFGEDGPRIKYTRNARKLLYQEHHDMVVDRLVNHLGVERGHVVAKLVDLSTCTMKRAAASQATLYDLPPTIAAADGDVEELAGALTQAGVWALMPRAQRDVLALRQGLMLMSIDAYAGGDPELVAEFVPPDLFHAYADPGNPRRMARLFVARKRPVPGRKAADGDAPVEGWYWDEYDLRDPKKPRFRVWRVDTTPDRKRRLQDMTEAHGIQLDKGWLKHAWDSNGVPVMPGIKYDAQVITDMFDAFENLGLYEGTMNVCMLKTHFLHVMKSAWWNQKVGINVRAPGADVEGEGQGQHNSLDMDPAKLLLLEQGDGDGEPRVMTLAASADPEQFLRAIHLYERDIIADSGLRSPSVQKMAGDPRSGQALEVDRDDERKLQARYKPSFGRSDRLMLRTAACMLNRATGSKHPETGHTVSYHGIPQSPAEKKALREHLTSLVEAGLMDPVDAYMKLNPGKTEVEALGDLIKIRDRRRELAGTDNNAANRAAGEAENDQV